MKQLDGSRYRNNNKYLVVGAQVGLGQHSFDWSGLWFSQQFDNSNPSLPFINLDASSGETSNNRVEAAIATTQLNR